MNRPDEGMVGWSGPYPIPQIGDRVRINFNNLGEAAVTGYLVEHGWFGLETRLLNAPTWHARQHPPGSKHHNRASVFGVEITMLTYGGELLSPHSGQAGTKE